MKIDEIKKEENVGFNKKLKKSKKIKLLKKKKKGDDDDENEDESHDFINEKNISHKNQKKKKLISLTGINCAKKRLIKKNNGQNQLEKAHVIVTEKVNLEEIDSQDSKLLNQEDIMKLPLKERLALKNKDNKINSFLNILNQRSSGSKILNENPYAIGVDNNIISELLNESDEANKETNMILLKNKRNPDKKMNNIDELDKDIIDYKSNRAARPNKFVFESSEEDN